LKNWRTKNQKETKMITDRGLVDTIAAILETGVQGGSEHALLAILRSKRGETGYAAVINIKQLNLWTVDSPKRRAQIVRKRRKPPRRKRSLPNRQVTAIQMRQLFLTGEKCQNQQRMSHTQLKVMGNILL